MSTLPICRLILVAAVLQASATSMLATPSAPSTPSGAQTPELQNDPAHPAAAHGWVETHLYFGLGPADAAHKGVSPAAWRAFLDQVVTPRFPSGLSVADVYGQWQSKPQTGRASQRPSRIRSKVIIIVYPATPQNSAAIESIRSAWKQRTGDQSVLKTTEPVDVSF